MVMVISVLSAVLLPNMCVYVLGCIYMFTVGTQLVSKSIYVFASRKYIFHISELFCGQTVFKYTIKLLARLSIISYIELKTNLDFKIVYCLLDEIISIV